VKRNLLAFLVVLLGVFVLCAVVVLLAPARAVTLATDQVVGLSTSAESGRLWKGEANVAFRGTPLGRLRWSLRFADLARGRMAVAWRLAHDEYTLSGSASQGIGETTFAASGTVDATALNRFLTIHHIYLEGEFEVDGLMVEFGAGPVPTTVQGALHWTGGRTTYRLSGQVYEAVLPPMTATAGSAPGPPAIKVVTKADGSRILTVRLDDAGWAHIAVTKRLTTLAANPWPGAEDEDAVVVTVAERLFETDPKAPD